MANGGDLSIGTRLAIGGIAGLVATVALTSTVRRLSPRPAGRAAPAAIDLLAPFATGMLCGALLAAAGTRPGRGAGALAGGGLWLAGEMGWLPAIAIRPAQGGPLRRSATMLAGQVAWGWSAAAAIRELADACGTNCAGPERR